MRIRSIIHAILVFTIIAAGLPVFYPEDADRNAEIDLKDAITHVKNVTRSAEHPDKFGSSVKKAISTFHIVAGLEENISQPKESGSSNHFDSFYLLAVCGFDEPPAIIAAVADRKASHETLTISPESPPPEHA